MTLTLFYSILGLFLAGLIFLAFDLLAKKSKELSYLAVSFYITAGLWMFNYIKTDLVEYLEYWFVIFIIVAVSHWYIDNKATNKDS